MEKENQLTVEATTPSLEDRKRAKLTGVTAVSCFNDREIVLETDEGEVALLGEQLHIEQLNLDDGELDVNGDIVGVEYSEKTKKRKSTAGLGVLRDERGRTGESRAVYDGTWRDTRCGL